MASIEKLREARARFIEADSDAWRLSTSVTGRTAAARLDIDPLYRAALQRLLEAETAFAGMVRSALQEEHDQETERLEDEFRMAEAAENDRLRWNAEADEAGGKVKKK